MDTKTYRLRPVGDGGYEVSIPKTVIECEADKHGLEPDEFIKRFRAVALYSGFEVLLYRFIEDPTVLPVTIVN